jgi:dihydroorotate dehydrogenase electron transfer subunit
MRIVKVKESKLEARETKTITFSFPVSTSPGQFYMVWIPGVDEIPMSVSFIDKQVKGITFRKVGEATSHLFHLKPGEKIGIRGPYGKGFNIKGEHILFVGGGTGIATIAPAAEEALKKGIKVTVVLGAKNKKELFFKERFKNCKLYVTTDDGSEGIKGKASDLAKKILEGGGIDAILTCGPEIMMKKLFEYWKDTSSYFEASLERYIKCAIGVCGQCCIGKGLRVCSEGPVFDGETLKRASDFGVFRRDASGRKEKVGD